MTGPCCVPGVGEGVGLGEGVGDGTGVGVGEGLGVGEGDGDGVGAGLGEGFGAGVGAGAGVGLGVAAAVLAPPQPATVSTAERTAASADAFHPIEQVIRMNNLQVKNGGYGGIYSACIGHAPICHSKGS